MVKLKMAGMSEIGIPIEITGSGELTSRVVHFNLNCLALGQSVGTMPADIRFTDSHHAVMTINKSGAQISANLNR